MSCILRPLSHCSFGEYEKAKENENILKRIDLSKKGDYCSR